MKLKPDTYVFQRYVFDLFGVVKWNRECKE